MQCEKEEKKKKKKLNKESKIKNQYSTKEYKITIPPLEFEGAT
jgi:hypothetical protein